MVENTYALNVYLSTRYRVQSAASITLGIASTMMTDARIRRAAVMDVLHLKTIELSEEMCECRHGVIYFVWHSCVCDDGCDCE